MTSPTPTPTLNLQTGLMENYLYGNQAMPMADNNNADLHPVDFGDSGFGLVYLSSTSALMMLTPDGSTVSGWSQNDLGKNDLGLSYAHIAAVFVSGKSRLFGITWDTSINSMQAYEIVAGDTGFTHKKVGDKIAVVVSSDFKFRVTPLNGDALLLVSVVSTDESTVNAYVLNADQASDWQLMNLGTAVDLTQSPLLSLVSGQWGTNLALICASSSDKQSVLWNSYTFASSPKSGSLLTQTLIKVPKLAGQTYSGITLVPAPYFDDRQHVFVIATMDTQPVTQNLWFLDGNQTFTTLGAWYTSLTISNLWGIQDRGTQYSLYAMTEEGILHSAQLVDGKWGQDGSLAFSQWAPIFPQSTNNPITTCLPFMFGGSQHGMYVVSTASQETTTEPATYTVAALYRVDDVEASNTTYKWRNEWALVEGASPQTVQHMSYRTCATLTDVNGNVAPYAEGTVTSSHAIFVSINGEKCWVEAGKSVAVTTNALGQLVIEHSLWNSMWTPQWTIAFSGQSITTTADDQVLTYLQGVTADDLSGLTIPDGVDKSDLATQIREVASANLQQASAYRLHFDFTGTQVRMTKTRISDDELGSLAGIGFANLPSFSDILYGLRNGVEEVKDITITVVNGVTSVSMTVESTLEDAAQFAYDNIQIGANGANNLFSLVGALCMKAGNSLEDVFKWAAGNLGGLFSWSDIVTLKDDIKKHVRNYIAQLPTSVTDQQTDFNTWFASAFTNLQQNLNALPAATATASASASVGGNLQSALGGDWSKATWLFDKLHVLSQIAGDVPDPGIGTMAGYVDTFSQSLPKNFPKFNDFTTAVTTAFAPYANDPSLWLNATATDLVGLCNTQLTTNGTNTIGSVCSAGVMAVSDDLFTCINNILAEAPNLFEQLDQPVDLPLLSGIYKLIAKEKELTLLDLMCLILAIPMHTVRNIASLDELTLEDGSPDWQAVEKWVGLFSALMGKMLTMVENIASNKKFVIVAGVLTLIANAASWGLAFNNKSPLLPYWYVKIIAGLFDWPLEYCAIARTPQPTAIVGIRFLLAVAFFGTTVAEASQMSSTSAGLANIFGGINTAAQFFAETTPATSHIAYNAAWGISSGVELYWVYTVSS